MMALASQHPDSRDPISSDGFFYAYGKPIEPKSLGFHQPHFRHPFEAFSSNTNNIKAGG